MQIYLPGPPVFDISTHAGYEYAWHLGGGRAAGA
jgi:hypothetical protein